jgi:hypothetical protein
MPTPLIDLDVEGGRGLEEELEMETREGTEDSGPPED